MDSKSDVHFKTSDPKKLSYKLREAIRASEKYPDFKHFQHLKYIYKFTVGDELLLATKRSGSSFPPTVIDLPNNGSWDISKNDELVFPDDGLVDGRVLNLAEVNRPVPLIETIPNTPTLLEVLVLSSMKEHKEKEELYFPDAELDDDEKSKLKTFATRQGWKLIINQVGLTLTKRPVPDGVEWDSISTIEEVNEDDPEFSESDQLKMLLSITASDESDDD